MRMELEMEINMEMESRTTTTLHSVQIPLIPHLQAFGYAVQGDGSSLVGPDLGPIGLSRG